MTFQDRARELGIELPIPSTPGANYVQISRVGALLFITGQLCQWNGERKFIGKLGREYDVTAGQKAARLSALNVIAHAGTAVDGDLSRIVKCQRVTGYVNATDSFTEHSQVMNGASDTFVEFFGDAGRHTRVAVGINGLPYGVAVEVEAIFEVA